MTATAAAGAVLVAVVAALLHRTAQPALEIRRYADEVLVASQGIARNLEGIDELARTRELAREFGGGTA
jgi:hypothetical protein